MDRRRIFELGGCGIDSGVDTDHSAAMGEVARPLPVFRATAGWLGQPSLNLKLLAAASDLVDKALKPFQMTNRLVHAFVHISGWLGQKLSWIGASGDMVCRLRVACSHDVEPCRLQRKAVNEKGGRPFFGSII